MKTLLAIVGGIVVFGFLGIIFIGWLAEQNTSSPTSAPENTAVTAVNNTLIGNWRGEDQSFITVSFNQSGTMTLHVEPELFVREECTLMANYRAVDIPSAGGTYILETWTHVIGNCGDKLAKVNAGDTVKEKLDLSGSDHIIMGPLRLARSQ